MNNEKINDIDDAQNAIFKAYRILKQVEYFDGVVLQDKDAQKQLHDAVWILKNYLHKTNVMYAGEEVSTRFKTYNHDRY